MEKHYTLMHKNIKVAEVTLSKATGQIMKMDCLYHEEHLPMGLQKLSDFEYDITTLNDWWRNRGIPASREGLGSLLLESGIGSRTLLLEKSWGLNLTDHYWVRPKNSEASWEEKNFFVNPFSKDVGQLLFENNEGKEIGTWDLFSPDNTTDGVLPKQWRIVDGKRCLFKAGNFPYKQQPLNEEAGSAILKALGIPYVPYTTIKIDGEVYSVCETFSDESIEFVPAYRIGFPFAMNRNEGNFDYLLRKCAENNIPKARDDLEKMLVFDYLMANTDRHVNNFGFMRHSETLEWLGLGPLFDNGNSLLHDGKDIQKLKMKPFKSKPADHLKLVQDLSWFDADKVKIMLPEVQKIFQKYGLLTTERVEQLIQLLQQRLDEVAQYKRELQKN